MIKVTTYKNKYDINQRDKRRKKDYHDYLNNSLNIYIRN
ncbi:hypothetical protein BACFRA24663_09440 [Bacteroides fragilis]